MPEAASEQGDVIARYDGEMLRQLLLGQFGLGGWGQVPLIAGHIGTHNPGHESNPSADWLPGLPIANIGPVVIPRLNGQRR